jgi:hypothetical protein
MKKAEVGVSRLTSEVVTARLRKAAELSQAPSAARRAVSMSAESVTRRLLECAEITALAWELQKAGERVGR